MRLVRYFKVAATSVRPFHLCASAWGRQKAGLNTTEALTKIGGGMLWSL
jgi:hypothetical protein